MFESPKKNVNSALEIKLNAYMKLLYRIYSTELLNGYDHLIVCGFDYSTM